MIYATSPFIHRFINRRSSHLLTSQRYPAKLHCKQLNELMPSLILVQMQEKQDITTNWRYNFDTTRTYRIRAASLQSERLRTRRQPSALKTNNLYAYPVSIVLSAVQLLISASTKHVNQAIDLKAATSPLSGAVLLR